jgi:hypothetical protein
MATILFFQDMCIGDFWETHERRSITTFTTALLVDKFTIVTIVDPDSNTEDGIPLSFPVQRSASYFWESNDGILSELTCLDSFLKIFEPFDLEVWALTLTMLILGGLCMYFVEHDFDRYDSPRLEASSLKQK